MRKSKFWTVLESGKRKKGNYLLGVSYDPSFLAVSALLSSVAHPSQSSLAEDVRKRRRNMLVILLFLKCQNSPLSSTPCFSCQSPQITLFWETGIVDSGPNPRMRTALSCQSKAQKLRRRCS